MVKPIKQFRTPRFLFQPYRVRRALGAPGKRRIRMTYTVNVADNFHILRREHGRMRRMTTVNDSLAVQQPHYRKV